MDERDSAFRAGERVVIEVTGETATVTRHTNPPIGTVYVSVDGHVCNFHGQGARGWQPGPDSECPHAPFGLRRL